MRNVDDETRSFMEEQFADCTTFEEVAMLYSDFQVILRELMMDKHENLIDDINNLI